MGEVAGVEGGVKVKDRISELPEPVIHHIMSFLRCPKDVFRTVVLSKKWKMIWTSFFTIDFDQRKFSSNAQFKTFIENSLDIKVESMLGLHKFRVYLTTFNLSMALDLNYWLSAAIKNVKELEIHVKTSPCGRYILPKDVLKIKTLTSLKLCGCKLDNYGVMDLPGLKELSIKQAYLNVDIIQSVIQRCPLLKDLRLVHCIGLDGLFISDHSELKRVEIHKCRKLKVVDVDLPNLTTFWYSGKISWQCKLNLVGCESLRYLTLHNSNITDELFQKHFSKFADLEKLVLTECNILKIITILSKKLRGISIIRCEKLENAMIDAPNLVSFEYTGYKTPFSSMSVASLADIRLHFESFKKINPERLQTFIEKFSKNEDWKVVTSSEKNVVINEENEEIRIHPSNNIKIELTKSFTNLKSSVANLLRMSYPETLTLVSSPGSELLKFLQDMIENREMNPSCCKYYTKKCWLHYLEDVERSETRYIPNSCGGGDESREIPSCSSSSAASLTVFQTTFSLKWRRGCSDQDSTSSFDMDRGS